VPRRECGDTAALALGRRRAGSRGRGAERARRVVPAAGCAHCARRRGPRDAGRVCGGTRGGAGGTSTGAAAGGPQRPEYSGGIGAAGLAAIHQFLSAGGTLVTFDTASELAIQFLALPVRNVVRPPAAADGEGPADPETPPATFSAPGSLIRLTVDPTHPIAFGMPREAIAMTTGGTAFEVPAAAPHGEGITSVARFASSDLLASGWASGEAAVLGRHALLEAKYGRGRVVMFGFRPQFRGQTFGTFKLLLNTVYLASARPQ